MHYSSGTGFGDGQTTGVALRQANKDYYANIGVTGLPERWTSFVRQGLRSADFSPLTNITGNAIDTTRPDFSATGAPIEFGFFRANSSIAGTYTTAIGIDNWGILINGRRGAGGNSSPTITTNSPLPPGIIGIPCSATFAAAGGTPPYSWAVASGVLPQGLSLTSATEVLAGEPTNTGDFRFTMRVTDITGATATKEFSLAVALPRISCTITPQNIFLQFHRPEFHTVGRHPDHILQVRVSIEDGFVATPPVSVSLAGTSAIFAPPGGAATSFTASAITNAAGEASFVVNPPVGASFDMTRLPLAAH